MSDGAPVAPSEALAALRGAGAAALDPARFAYLEALSRRLPQQAAPVQRLLLARLQSAVAAYAQRWAAQRPADAATVLPLRVRERRAARAAAAPHPPACTPLAELNRYIRERSPSLAADVPGAVELASARRFREAWAGHHAQAQLERAEARKPVNAGPLNSHALVLESLGLMQDLSPEYLRRFLLQVESLQWLEQAGQAPPAPGRANRKAPAKRTRQKP